METTLQLNGHVTGAFRHSNSWCWWYCRKGSVTPQYPQSWGRMSHSPACLSTSPRGNVCMQPWWVHWTGSWRHCCWWSEMFSNGPVQLHPSALLTQYTSSESTTLSKVIMPSRPRLGGVAFRQGSFCYHANASTALDSRGKNVSLFACHCFKYDVLTVREREWHNSLSIFYRDNCPTPLSN